LSEFFCRLTENLNLQATGTVGINDAMKGAGIISEATKHVYRLFYVEVIIPARILFSIVYIQLKYGYIDIQVAKELRENTCSVIKVRLSHAQPIT
jgi:hypothetical protein